MTNQLVALLVLIVFATTIAELPWVEKNVIIPMTEDHPHLTVLMGGIVGMVLAWWGGKKPEHSVGEK